MESFSKRKHQPLLPVAVDVVVTFLHRGFGSSCKLILRESVMDVRERWNCPFIRALRRVISEFILPICD